MILDFANKWNTGDILTVNFLNGTGKLHDKVIEVINEWEQLINIKFLADDSDNAKIRVRFNGGKNDSKIGTDALTEPAENETMSFASIHADSDPVELRYYVLHEFGHALGLVHEHFHPDADIQFNVPETIKHFQRLSGFSEADVKQNLLRKYLVNQVYCSRFDEHSLMMYNIPAICTLDGKEYKESKDLTDIDKEFISLVYPQNESIPAEISPDAETEFEISNLYEEKIFQIIIVPAEEKRYTFSVESDEVTALSLFRYEDEGDRNGYVDYIKPIDEDVSTAGKIASIELTEFNTKTRPNINEYYLRVKQVNSDSTSGIIRVSAL